MLEFGLWSLPPGNSCFVLLLIKTEEQREGFVVMWARMLSQLFYDSQATADEMDMLGETGSSWNVRAPASSPLWKGDFPLWGVAGPFGPWGVIWRICGRCFCSDRERPKFPKLLKPLQAPPNSQLLLWHPTFSKSVKQQPVPERVSRTGRRVEVMAVLPQGWLSARLALSFKETCSQLVPLCGRIGLLRRHLFLH